MTPLLLGHRGHRSPEFLEPENSLRAFDRALGCGCDGLELDLRLAASGGVVVAHDQDATLGASKLATLEQVLRRYHRTAFLDLEMKEPEVAEELVRLLRRWPPQRGFVVTSFEQGSLECVRELDAAGSIPLGLNLRRPRSVRLLKQARVEWVAPQQATCAAWYVRRLRAEGWRVLVWTVNRPAKMRLLARAGADAIVSDHPAILVSTLREQTS